MNEKQLIEELLKLNIKLTNNQLNQLKQYYELLVEENNKYNLTRIIEENEVYLKHFYDSLTISKIKELNNQKICDIGTGAGFPGIVLKIVYPELDMDLIESNNKKCYFLNLVIKKLDLNKITVKNVRVEEYGTQVREEYDIVVARAVAPINHLLEFSMPLLKINGQFIAMKANLSNELDNLKPYLEKLNCQLIKELDFELPYEKSNRKLMMYQKQDKTSNKYPRKYSEIKKKTI